MELYRMYTLFWKAKKLTWKLLLTTENYFDSYILTL